MGLEGLLVILLRPSEATLQKFSIDEVTILRTNDAYLHKNERPTLLNTNPLHASTLKLRLCDRTPQMLEFLLGAEIRSLSNPDNILDR